MAVIGLMIKWLYFSIFEQSYKRVSFPQPKCFHTFAVWKHFFIYHSPAIGCPYPTDNFYFSSVCSHTTCRLKKSSLSAYSNGLTSDFYAAPPTAHTSSSSATDQSRKPRLPFSRSSPPQLPSTT